MLNPRLAELEELAAIGQASAQHAEYHYEAQLRSADELELAQREELMRLRARLSSDEPAVYSERQALETAFRTELDASEARATAAHQATSATLALTKRDAYGGGVVRVDRARRERGTGGNGRPGCRVAGPRAAHGRYTAASTSPRSPP